MSSLFSNHSTAERFFDPEPSRRLDSHVAQYASFLSSHKQKVKEQENQAIARVPGLDENTSRRQKLFMRWSEEVYFYEENPSKVTERKLLNFLYQVQTNKIGLPELGKVEAEHISDFCAAIIALFKKQVDELKVEWPCPETPRVISFVKSLYKEQNTMEEIRIQHAQLNNTVLEMQLQMSGLRKEIESLKGAACPASPSSITSSNIDPIFPFEMAEKSRASSPASEGSHSSPSSDIPVFTFNKTVTSVKDAWKEYCKGINGGLAVKELENMYGAKWRSVNATKKFFSRRKILYHAIEVGISRGRSEDECIQRLETIRTRKEAGRTTLKSLNWLQNYLRDDQQIYQIMG